MDFHLFCFVVFQDKSKRTQQRNLLSWVGQYEAQDSSHMYITSKILPSSVTNQHERYQDINVLENSRIQYLSKSQKNLIVVDWAPHLIYHVVSLDCLKASDEQIGFSTTPHFQLLWCYKFFILYLYFQGDGYDFSTQNPFPVFQIQICYRCAGIDVKYIFCKIKFFS